MTTTTTTTAPATTKSFHIELLKKFKKSENLNSTNITRENSNMSNSSKMEQLIIDRSATNSSCSSNAPTPTRESGVVVNNKIKSANSFKTSPNNNKSANRNNSINSTPSNNKQLNRANTVSAASIR